MLEIINLTQTYFYGATALNDISFKVGDDEKIAVLSKSGGGKTSLLKCIAGLFPASSGKIVLDGKDITELKIKDRNVRLIYDDGGIIRKRTVKFNLEYPLKLRKYNKNDRFIKAYNTAKDFGLEPFYKEYAFRLFEPEIIALALARTTLRDCSLTLIDNLFALVNGLERNELFRKYLPLLKNIKGSVIFATDSLEEALSFGDKVLVLDGGYLQQFASPNALINNSQSFSVEKIVNFNKVSIIVKVENGMVEIDGIKISISETDVEEVIVSYHLKKDGCGKSFNLSYKEYLGNGLYNYVSDLGEGLIAHSIDENTTASIDVSSIRVFNRVSEKLLTHIII